MFVQEIAFWAFFVVIVLWRGFLELELWNLCKKIVLCYRNIIHVLDLNKVGGSSHAQHDGQRSKEWGPSTVNIFETVKRQD